MQFSATRKGNSFVTEPGFMTACPAGILASFTSQCEGKRSWKQGGVYAFEATTHNARLWNDTFGGNLEMEAMVPSVAAGAFSKFAVGRPSFIRKTAHWVAEGGRSVQAEAAKKMRGMSIFALFMVMGSGKTKVMLDELAESWCEGSIDAAIVFAPNGVHEQWVYDAIPEHCPVEVDAYVWRRGINADLSKIILTETKMPVLTINYEAVDQQRSIDAVESFIARFNWRVAMVLDEAHRIKSPFKKRTKAINALGWKCSKRFILTGTPIAKNVIDLWSLFRFLNEQIIGHKYLTTFRNAFCIMGGWQGKSVVGHKDIKRLYNLIEPYTYRCDKEDLGLPPKAKMRHVFEMSPAQRRAYDDLKANLSTKLDDGTIITVANAAVMLTKLQQITCGRLHLDKDNFDRLDNARLKALSDLLQDIPEDEKIVIWCRFNEDVVDVCGLLGDEARPYYGPTKQADRDRHKEEFIDPNSSVRFLVGSTDTMGTGTDGLQKVCSLAIYYSNSFNSVHRWQSEDRIDRLGMAGTSRYIDLHCRGGIDAPLSRNLQAKKSISDLTLDDIRKMIDGE